MQCQSSEQKPWKNSTLQSQYEWYLNSLDYSLFERGEMVGEICRKMAGNPRHVEPHFAYFYRTLICWVEWTLCLVPGWRGGWSLVRYDSEDKNLISSADPPLDIFLDLIKTINQHTANNICSLSSTFYIHSNLPPLIGQQIRMELSLILILFILLIKLGKGGI